MRIAVAGGTGLLGRALVTVLRADGHDVRVLTRSPREPGDVEWAPGRGTAWRQALGAVDAVVNLAGAPIAGGRWTAARKRSLRDSRLGSTRALAEAIAAAPRPPLVFLSGSAIGIYGTRGDEPLTEETEPGSDFLGTLAADWEREALAVSNATRVVLLRTGLVLAREGGALPRLALPFRFFAGGPLGTGRQYVSWVHVDDWVEMVRWALANGPSGPLNVTAPDPVTNAEFARTLGRVLHRPAFLPAPGFALRLALGEMADALILGGQRVMPAKALALGFRFRYPSLEPALQAIYGD